jgi:simple sugar transport system ATP-binding protein
MLRDSRQPPYAQGIFLSIGALHDKAGRLMKEYDIRGQGPKTVAARLSGGNQQKIVIARELDRKPAVLIAHQAAWGLDPGATRFVLERVLALREEGAAILYFSSELEEVLEVADRIAVMANRGFAGVTMRKGADIGQIGLWMSGRAA